MKRLCKIGRLPANRRARILLCALLSLLLISTGCQAKADLPQTLLTIDGEERLSLAQFSFAKTNEALLDKYYGTGTSSEKDLFLSLAEEVVCCYFAEQYGVAENRELLDAEYEGYLETLKNGGYSQAEADYFSELQQIYAASTLKELWVERAYIESSAQHFVESVAQSYGMLRNASVLEEEIVKNIAQIASFYEIQNFYPGLETHVWRFTSVLS